MRPVVQSLNQDIFICMTRWLLQTQHADPECFCIVLKTQNGRHSGGYLTNFKETASQYTTLSIIKSMSEGLKLYLNANLLEISHNSHYYKKANYFAVNLVFLRCKAETQPLLRPHVLYRIKEFIFLYVYSLISFAIQKN